jgi:hypothetical protein
LSKNGVCARGSLSACRQLATWKDNVTSHLLKGATHGFDDNISSPFTFECCGGQTVHVVPNLEAVEKTKNVIYKAIKGVWNI